ncbi:MAG: hypothetical protein HOI23_01945 [Deltaproteobacteria bacterium]|jgi:hypothetical protein|nr:hypothetical protein [Deltaproteobacteria bacterium]MBT6432893.1 hypothetical protein [Deltaproteobacteria bacterium]
MRTIILLGAFCLIGFCAGCDGGAEESTLEQEATPWDQGRVEALRMPGVVDAPGKIYRKAYDRAMGQITGDNLLDRLEALEREIEMERNELK